jgi:hypothetical protein
MFATKFGKCIIGWLVGVALAEPYILDKPEPNNYGCMPL